MRKLVGKKTISMLNCIIVLTLPLCIIFFCLIFKHTKVESKHPDKYFTVIVESGQTLWGIASKFNNEGEDIRKMVHEIKKANNINNALIVPGQLLKIPEQ